MSTLTPFQTIGPFFDVLLRSRHAGSPVADGAPGTRITIEGTLCDGAGAPVCDGLIETWQADAQGRYAGTGIVGHRWSATDDGGRFRVETIKPGRVPMPDGRLQAPHVLVSVMARGVLTRYVTRAYFDDEPENAGDPILEIVPAARRETLVARTAGEGVYRFDIRIQGADETVFFDL